MQTGKDSVMRLYEKYRPRDLAEVIGHDHAKRQIQCVLRNGWGGQAFWISGESGTGKTTLGRIIAAYGASDFFIQEYDSADVVTSEVLTDIEYYMTFGAGGKGGRAYIINEAHALRGVMVRRLLGILERVPAHVVFVFTTTQRGQKHLFDNQLDAGPLLSRCIPIELNTFGLTEPFAVRCREIAVAEGLDGRPLGDYIRLAQANKQNLRAMLQAVEAGKMKEQYQDV
jgi:replication-associated recombination protein RarA